MKPFLALAACLAIGGAALAPLAAQAHAPGYQVVQHGYHGPVRRAVPVQHYDYRPHARRGYIWSQGHWERHGHRRVWVGGGWVRVRPVYGSYGGYGGGYRGQHRRDLDRDGVPNRYDRDRDGDGVRNEHDRRPNNPYR